MTKKHRVRVSLTESVSLWKPVSLSIVHKMHIKRLTRVWISTGFSCSTVCVFICRHFVTDNTYTCDFILVGERDNLLPICMFNQSISRKTKSFNIHEQLYSLRKTFFLLYIHSYVRLLIDPKREMSECRSSIENVCMFANV